MKSSLTLVRQHLRAYLALNILFYGLVLAATAYSFARPDLQRQLTQAIVQGFNAPPLSLARDAYLSGNVLAAALITFLVNFFVGSLLTLTVPSLLIPFAGTVVGLYRALLWGIALAPTTPEMSRAMVPHSLTLLLEGQGYILAMLGIHLLWTSAFDKVREGISPFLSAYVAGLRANVRIYFLVAAVLAVAAVYEAFEVIYLVGR